MVNASTQGLNMMKISPRPRCAELGEKAKVHVIVKLQAFYWCIPDTKLFYFLKLNIYL